jgi:hypothetical protein
MKYIFITTILLIFCTKIGYSQILSPELGYNSGFTGTISIIPLNNEDFEMPFIQEYYLRHFHPSIGYDFLISDGEYFHGPNLQASYGFLFSENSIFGMKAGLSTSLLFNNGDSQWVLEPVLTFNMLFFQIKTYYNLLETDNFFPNDYSKWSISFAVDFPLRKK